MRLESPLLVRFTCCELGWEGALLRYMGTQKVGAVSDETASDATRIVISCVVRNSPGRRCRSNMWRTARRISWHSIIRLRTASGAA